jgi:hypothetical protein
MRRSTCNRDRGRPEVYYAHHDCRKCASRPAYSCFGLNGGDAGLSSRTLRGEGRSSLSGRPSRLRSRGRDSTAGPSETRDGQIGGTRPSTLGTIAGRPLRRPVGRHSDLAGVASGLRAVAPRSATIREVWNFACSPLPRCPRRGDRGPRAVSGKGLDTANARCVRWGGPAATGGWRSGPVWVAKRSTRGS